MKPTTCNVCRTEYSWPSFLALPAGDGGTKLEVDDGVFAEVRNCPCGATMARLPTEEPGS